MANYGWEVYNQYGQPIADDSMFNCFYVDHWLSPAHQGSRTKSFNKSYPDLRYSTVKVIVGPTSSNIGSDASISVSVTYPNNIPTVSITETVSNAASSDFGATFWIVATRIDRNSPINNTYGIQLLDGSSGVSFVDGLPPLVYIGKGTATSAEPVSTNQEGKFYIETWNNVPPVCFWRTTRSNVGSIGNVRNETVPYLSAVRKSSQAPTQKNYRWALMVQYSPIAGTPTSSSGKEVFCFEPYHISMDQGDTFGLQVMDGSLPINIGTQKPLYIQSLNPMNSAYLSGNNLISSLSSNYAAITNAPYIIKWVGTYDYDTVFWYTGGNHLDGIHVRQSSGGTNYAGYSPGWWQTQRDSLGYESYVIDYTMYT